MEKLPTFVYVLALFISLFIENSIIDELTLKKLSIGFGGGLGRQRLTCGAVSGMATILGLISDDSATKSEVYATTQALCKAFVDENGSLICKDLLTGANLQVSVGGEAEKRTEEYYKKRPCAEIVYSAAKILEEYLNNR